MITESELLARPERESDKAAIEQINGLLSEDGIYVIGVDRLIARRAAVLRGRTRLKLADAIIVATAAETGCEAVVGNDRGWARQQIDVPFVLLDDLVGG